jgi:acyl carrier protein
MYEQLKRIVSAACQVPAGDVTPDSTLEDLGLDSLDLVELSLVIEKEIGVKVSDDELAEAGRLDSITELVTSRNATV